MSRFSGGIHYGILLVVFLGQWSCSDACSRSSGVYIQDNEYRGMLIGIREDVPENPELLTRIEQVFTQTSRLLYQRTNQRAYWRDITILVPTTWSDSVSYGSAQLETGVSSDIDIRNANLQEADPDRPFTITGQQCGQLGYHISLTDRHLLNASYEEVYGPYEKVLLHEWAHLRYGIYDEYPITHQDKKFYVSSSGDIEATRCSLQLQGSYISRMTKTGCSNAGSENNLYDEDDCEFIDDTVQEGEYGTLMYKQYLHQVVEFCDNDASMPATFHNKEAPNEHNRICNGRSAWEVMRSHADFENEANPPREITDPIPTFHVVRRKDGEMQARRTVLVLDTSSSMADQGRIGRLKQGCARYIDQLVEDGEYLGIVAFNGRARTLANLTLVSNDTRQELVDSVPSLPWGKTSIGAGLRRGLSLLREDGIDLCGTLILVSDGDETKPPYIADVESEVVGARCITVHTIAITDAADPEMDQLATNTSGLSFLDASDRSNTIQDAFTSIQNFDRGASDSAEVLESRVDWLPGDTLQLSGSALIDSSVGNQTVFTADYERPLSTVNLTVTSPSGETYTEPDSCSRSASQRIISCIIPGDAEAGEWTYFVKSDTAQRIAITVTSKPRYQAAEHPITAAVCWSSRNLDLMSSADPQKVFVAVHKGNLALLRANVSAIVETPYGAEIDIPLLDNGAGADLRRNDGVYSAFFSNYHSMGRYNVKVRVSNTGSTVISPYVIIGVGAASSVTLPQDLSDIPVQNLSRVTSGGSFQLTNFTGSFVYPPARITDLTLLAVDSEARTITLQWTAVGAQLDSGTAYLYEIRMGRRYADVMDDAAYVNVTQASLLTGQLDQPQPAASIEIFTIYVPMEQGNVSFFGVIVHNAAVATSSDLSNIVSATFNLVELVYEELEPRTSEKTEPAESMLPTSQPSTSETIEPTENPQPASKPSSRQNRATMFRDAMIYLLVVVVLVGAGITGVVFWRRKLLRKSAEAKRHQVSVAMTEPHRWHPQQDHRPGNVPNYQLPFYQRSVSPISSSESVFQPAGSDLSHATVFRQIYPNQARVMPPRNQTFYHQHY